MDSELLRVWQLIHELSEQLSHNQKLASSLQAQAGILQNQSGSTRPGFALRRFNTDITKEVFESELERTNAQVIIENRTLLHENKQLGTLLKEYEETMETIMSKFRNHALAAQQHELTLTRHYEALLQARETQGMSTDLASSTNAAQSLHRLAQNLRMLLRSLSGQQSPEFEHVLPQTDDTDFDPHTFKAVLQSLEDDMESLNQDDWAVEREAEITRLETENEELRRQLGIDSESLTASGVYVDERFLTATPRSILTSSSSNRRRSGSGGGSSGGGGGVGLDAWGQRPPPAPYSLGQPGSNGHTGPDSHAVYQQHQQQQQQQQQHTLPVQLQRPIDMPPQQQGGGLRLQAGRRPAMFGAGGRGGAIPRGPSLWAGAQPQPIPQLGDRSWQSQGGSASDLSLLRD